MPHPPPSRPLFRSYLAGVIGSALLLTALLRPSPAQVRTTLTPDGSLGTAVTLQPGNVYAITGGRRPGNGPNLFHSFERFSVGTGDTASFQGPAGITNILSRVTGGQLSAIDGTLHSAIPGANLYLLNPSGVLFGPNARLDVSGSFHVSTADYLRLADGARFAARLSDTTTLSVAAPEAFGFLRDSPAGIALQGSALQVPEGATLAIVGGAIQISGGRSAPDPSAPSTLGAPQGRVTVVSVAAPGEVNPHGSGQVVSTLPRLGAIEIRDGARLDTSGEGGGTITIRGGSLAIDRTILASDTLGRSHGAQTGIDIQVTGEVIVRHTGQIVRDNGGRVVRTEGITTHAGPDRGVVSTGDAGAIRLVADRVQLVDSFLGSESWQTGNAGATVVQAREIRLSDGARLSGTTRGAGQGGTVTVTAAERLSLQGTSPQGTASAVFADTVGTGTGSGNAGTVLVRTRDMLLSDGARIGSMTSGPSQGGNVTVAATETLILQGDNPVQPGFPTGVFVRAAGTGNAGTGTVQARHIVLSQGAQINGSTFGAGRGGTVMVKAAETLTLQGISPDGPGGILAQTEGNGAAGSVNVQARDIVLSDGAQIDGTTGGAGRGGTVTVTATETLTLRGSNPQGTVSGIFAETMSTRANAGAAGSVNVQARDIVLSDGAQIGGTTRGAGRGGTVTVTATETLTLQGGDPQGRASGVFADTVSPRADAGAAGSMDVQARDIILSDGAMLNGATDGTGRGGTVTVTATETLTLTGGGRIFANARSERPGAGNAGVVRVQARDITLSDGYLFSETMGVGSAGPVTVTATETLTLTGDSAIAAEALKGAARAGNVAVEAREVRLSDNAFITSTTRGDGPAGPVTVTATEALTLTGNSHISANSGSGRDAEITVGVGPAGAVMVQAKNVQLSNNATITSLTLGPGQGGRVNIAATGTLTIRSDASRQGNPAGIYANTQEAEAGAGNAGDITVLARDILLDGGGVIASLTSGPGRAGTVRVTAMESLTLQGTGPQNASVISTNTQGNMENAGPAGAVVIQAQHVVVRDGAQIASRTFGPDQGGTITIQGPGGPGTRATTLQLAKGKILTGAIGDGPGGDIIIQASAVALSDKAQISATAAGRGNAGAIRITGATTVRSVDSAVTTETNAGAGGAVTLEASTGITLTDTTLSATVQGGSKPGGDVILTTPTLTLTRGSLKAETGGAGQAGNITLNIDHLTTQGTTLTSSSTGLATGNAGTVTVQGLGGPGTRATRLTLSESTVATAATTADGGDIQLRTQGTLRLRDSQITTAVGSGQGRGGNIAIDSDYTLLERSQIRADAFGGPGGNIRLGARGFLADADSRLSASSQQNVDGRIDIQAVTTPSGLVAPPPPDFPALTALLRDPCTARLQEGHVSSLVVRERESTPAAPDWVLPGRLYAGVPEENHASRGKQARGKRPPARPAGEVTGVPQTTPATLPVPTPTWVFACGPRSGP